MSRELGDGDLRPYLPHAVCEILEAICAFENRSMVLDEPMVERNRPHVLHPGRRPDPSASVLGMPASVGFDEAGAQRSDATGETPGASPSASRAEPAPPSTASQPATGGPGPDSAPAAPAANRF
ncbi:MAG: hypothetical protein U5R31_04085 [Acidimicrobiia bacterium]|nr:hypothetical protein [Acidimicrobiia bacterium]